MTSKFRNIESLLGRSLPWLVAIVPMAFAGSKAYAYCGPAEQIRGQIAWCYQNSAFVEEASQCRAKLLREIDETAKGLTNAFQASYRKSTGEQVESQSNSASDLALSENKLAALISKAKAVEGEIGEYQGHLLYLGNLSPAYLTYLGLLGEHQHAPCFFENYQALSSIQSEVRKKRSELEASSLAVSHKKKSSLSREVGLGVGDGSVQKIVAGARQPEQSKSFLPGSNGPVSPSGSSDITGGHRKNPNE